MFNFDLFSSQWHKPFKGLIEKYTKPGLVLRGFRHREGLSQAQLAKRVGSSQQVISRMERGELVICREMACQLSQALNITPYKARHEHNDPDPLVPYHYGQDTAIQGEYEALDDRYNG